LKIYGFEKAKENKDADESDNLVFDTELGFCGFNIDYEPPLIISQPQPSARIKFSLQPQTNNSTLEEMFEFHYASCK